MTALLLLIVAGCAALPMAEAAALLPAIWLLQRTLLGDQAALLSAGPVDITAADLVLLMLLARLALDAVRSRGLVVHRPLYLALAAFLLVNLLATLAAGVRFGGEPFARGVTALARLCSEMALVLVLAQGVKSLPQARRCARFVLGTLGVLAAIQFVNYFGASHGFTIGEVQGLERGEPRFFGPVGDSIGAVLLLGYLCSLCLPSMVGIGSFAGGIVLTAGLGAIFSAGVGTVLFVFLGAPAAAVRRAISRFAWLLPVVAFAALVAVLTAGQPLARTFLDRVSGGNYSSSATQRIATATMAGAMIADNPLTGVGYTGYEPALARYGGAKFFDLAHSDGATANANNQILQSLTDAGVPGLLAFAAVVVCAARLLLGVARRCGDRILSVFHRGAFLWLLAQVFGNVAAVWLVPSSYVARFLWVALGTAVAVARFVPPPAPAVAAAFERDDAPLVSA